MVEKKRTILIAERHFSLFKIEKIQGGSDAGI
jgi:hypothetical protein